MMALARSSMLALVIAPLLGCSSGAEETSTGAGGSESGSGAGTGAVFDPGGPVTTVTASMGPVTTQPGNELTECITVRLSNTEGAFVRRFRAALHEGSHHMIVYRSSAAFESPTPTPCSGFSGLLSGDHPIFIAQQAESELVLPTDASGGRVALEIAPGQMVRIEMHYINTTGKAIDVTGSLHLDTVPLDTAVIQSDLAFWGTQVINIAPSSEAVTNVQFNPALADTKTFALTTHQHHLGTRMRVWYADDINDTDEPPVADGKNWSDPPLELFDPPLEFPDSGDGETSSKGFAYQCEWKNTTPFPVGFGEGFDDEMCFLWHYYYPSQGFQICMDGFCELSDG
jgi:hypothetical protein